MPSLSERNKQCRVFHRMEMPQLVGKDWESLQKGGLERPGRIDSILSIFLVLQFFFLFKN